LTVAMLTSSPALQMFHIRLNVGTGCFEQLVGEGWRGGNRTATARRIRTGLPLSCGPRRRAPSNGGADRAGERVR